MRLSPWHMEVAKRVAEGKKFKELSAEIKISQSRLSVLKANPLFQKQVKKYRESLDDGYGKAVGEFNNNAKAVAAEVVKLALSKAIEPRDKLAAAREVLDRLGTSTGVGSTDRQAGEHEVSFEQILRITKKRGQGIEPDDEQDYAAAQKDLMVDLENMIDVTPSPQEAA